MARSSSIEIGRARVHVLREGSFAVDGGALFGVVPRPLWERTNPPDGRNRVRLGLNVALLEVGGRRLLVDTGVGERWGEMERRIYGIDRSRRLLAGLERLGLRPDDIDVVVNSHLHFDHAGGNTRSLGGRLRPTFARARYVVQKGEWDDATHPHERSRASYREEDFVPLAEAGRLELVEGEAEIVPGVRLIPSAGHTAHHQIVVLESEGRRLVIPTDLLPTTSHLPLPFVMGYDLFPVGTLEAKRRLLARAAEDGSLILFYHDRRRPLGRVRRERDRYVFDEVSP